MPRSQSSSPPTDNPRALTYADSGVDIEAGDAMVGMIQSLMRRTHGPRVIDRPGGFAGLFRLDFNEKLFRRNYREPVLVACTDGVGSKVKLARCMGVYDTVGIDCVAMCVNDMIVEGAEPLFFLDYFAVHRLDPAIGAQVVKGVADGCRLAGCALLGGETAELPDIYSEGDFDLAGFAVGVVELDRAVDPGRAEPGDIIIGLASSGVHSNGYSLVRRIVEEAGLDLERMYTPSEPGRPLSEPGRPRPRPGSRTSQLADEPRAPSPEPRTPTLGEILLTPTRIYARSIVRLLRRYRVKRIITGMAHITGGGLPGNVSRALSPDVDAVLDTAAWDAPPIFDFLQRQGRVERDEMFRVFNMGIGYVLIVRPSFANAVVGHLTMLREDARIIGRIEPGRGEVRLV